MSFAATQAVWLRSTFSGSHKLVLLCIAHHQNDSEGVAWPSIDRIAAMCGIGRRRVFEILHELTEAGEIQRRSGMKAGRANRYVVTTPLSAGVQPNAPQGEPQRTDTRAAERTPPVRPAAPELVLNDKTESARELQVGRSGAADGVDVLVDAGVSPDDCEQLLDRLRSTGKRAVSVAEARAFVAEVGRCRGWTVAEAVEEIGPGLACRVLHQFQARFLPARGCVMPARPADKVMALAPSKQRLAIQSLEALKGHASVLTRSTPATAADAAEEPF